MKNTILALLLLLFSFSVLSQSNKFEFYRNQSAVKEEKLKEIRFISDITPQLWANMALSREEYKKLDYLRSLDLYKDWYVYLYPQAYNYNKFIDYVFVEISATCNGKNLFAVSASDKLTVAQKNIFNTADLNTEIKIKIKYKYKNEKYSGEDNKIIDGQSLITVVPQTEAKYSGGEKQLEEYITKNIFDKALGKNALEKIQQAAVKFIVNEEGKIVEIKLLRTSNDSKIDQLIIDVINKMPKWEPAKNTSGIKVRQEFNIPFGSGGC